jgi:predicted Zn-dependent protease
MGITYDVIATWNANAQAIDLADGPHSGIGAGFLAVIDWVSTAMAIGYKYHDDRCATAYIHSLSDAIIQNSRAASGTGKYAIIGSPFAFALSSPTLCPGVTEAAFRADQHADDLRELWIRGSLDYVLAHELGHHVLGHTATSPANYPESRQREAKADAFAFRVMAKAGLNPVLCVPVMLLWCNLEGFSIEGEGTHPAGVRRMRVMIAAARQAVNDDPEVAAAMQKDGTRGQWETLIQKMDSMLAEAEKQ